MSKDLTGANRPWRSNVKRLNLPFERPLPHSNVGHSNIHFWRLNVQNFSWFDNGFSQLQLSNSKSTPNFTKVSRVKICAQERTITLNGEKEPLEHKEFKIDSHKPSLSQIWRFHPNSPISQCGASSS